MDGFGGYTDICDFSILDEEILRWHVVYNWIDKQLEGTSVTVVLLGTNTLTRPFFQYEICKSIKRGNVVIGVHVHNIKDMQTG